MVRREDGASLSPILNREGPAGARAEDGPGTEDDPGGRDVAESDVGRAKPGAEGDEGGNEDGYDQPDLLMKALGRDDPAVRLYGWVEGGVQFNPADPRNDRNLPNNSTSIANRYQFRQVYLAVEKAVERGDRIDFGFRADNLLGSDAGNFHADSLFDRAFTRGGYGYSPTQFYGEAHIPVLTPGGVDLKVGRFISLAGYESAFAPGRPLMSTGYLFNYSHPFTHVGVLSTWNATDRLQVYNAAVNGWDRWINENNRWGYHGGFSWDALDDRTNLTVTLHAGPNQISRSLPRELTAGLPADVIRDFDLLPGRHKRGDVTELVTAILSRELGESWTLILEGDYGHEGNIPISVGNPRTLDSTWYGVGVWLLRDFNDHLTGVARSTVFRDSGGVRTGYDDTYYEATLGLIWKPRPWLWARPEIRYDGSQGVPPFDGGRARSQVTLGFDVIFLF